MSNWDKDQWWLFLISMICMTAAVGLALHLFGLVGGPP